MALKFAKHIYMSPADGGEGGSGAGGGSGDGAGGGNGDGGNTGGESGGLMADALKKQQGGEGGQGEGGSKTGGDNGGTGGAGAGANGGDPGGAGAGGEGKGEGGDGKPKRPDFLPEQFWDAEKGEPRLESMAKAYNDTRQALKTKGGEAPKTPEEYEFKAPEGMEVSKDDPGVKFFRNAAHKAGLSNEKFNEVAGLFLQQAHESGLLEPIKPIDEKEEIKKLGPGGDAKVAAVTSWGVKLKESGIWNDQDLQEIVILGSTAEGITALNKLREFYSGERIPTTGQDGQLSADAGEYYKRMGEKDANGNFRMETDTAFRMETEEMGRRIFGTDPAKRGRAGIPGAPR